MTLYDKLIKVLEKLGVETIFSFPGETTLALYQAIHSSKNISHITTGCERCAGFMADVYSRITNKVGVFTSPGGVGSPWAIPALHEAYNSSIPILLIVSGVSTKEVGYWSTSECDQLSMVKPFCKKSLRLENPEKLEDYIKILINSAIGGRPGPVVLEIPIDLALSEQKDCRSSFPFSIKYPNKRPIPEDKDLQQLIDCINESNKTVIVAGGGVLISGASIELNNFSTKYKIPVVTTLNGKGSYDEFSELSMGVVGNKGISSINKEIDDFDLVIILGSKMGDKSTLNRTLYNKCKLYRIDINDEEANNIYDPEILLIGDIKATLSKLLELDTINISETNLSKFKDNISTFRESYLKYDDNEKKCSIPLLIDQINFKYGGQLILCADASSSSGWIGALSQLCMKQRCVVTPRGSGTLGFGLPAVIGATLSSPNTIVIGLGGDTGFLMSCHEIETAVRYNLKFIYFIINNNSMGLLDRNLEKMGYCKTLLKKNTSIDWMKIITGFGAKYFTLKSNDDIVYFFDNIIIDGPIFVEVIIDKGVTPPDFN